MSGRSVRRSTFVLVLAALAGVLAAGCSGGGTPVQAGGSATAPVSSVAGDPGSGPAESPATLPTGSSPTGTPAGSPTTPPNGGLPTNDPVTCQVMVIMKDTNDRVSQYPTDFDAIARWYLDGATRIGPVVAGAPGTPGAEAAVQVGAALVELSKQYAAHPATRPDDAALTKALEAMPPCTSAN